MKKIITALVLTLAFSAPIFADGNIPISGYTGDIPVVGRDGHTPITGLDGHIPIGGYAGCEGGFWYPESQVCCIPGQECIAGRSAPSNNAKNNILSGLINVFRNIYF
jgi:hypothetical protein